MAFPTLFPRRLASFNDSRQRKVDFDDYVKHLLYYKDGRFARHPQFRYWAFNSLMRSRAFQNASWLTKQHPDKGLTLAELKEMALRNDNHLAENIVRKADSLRGTRPYWKTARQELEAMVLCVGPPSLFFTLSAADMQWSDLHTHLPSNLKDEYAQASSGPAKATIASRFLQLYPHVAAEYLKIRFRLFFNEVLKKKFKIKDH